MREIVLDTETTGLSPHEGHRLVEIGCLELFNHVATGKVYHTYIDPERDMPDGAFQVHGLSTEFLRGKPKFAEVADAFLTFIGDDPLVIHNASFDMTFINWELERAGRAALPRSRAIDTLEMARQRFPARRTISTRFAAASAWIIQAAPSMARCSTANFWRKSIWN